MLLPRAALSAAVCTAALVVSAATPIVPAAIASPTRSATAPDEITRVVVISVDGLNPTALSRLGRAKTPTFHRLIDEGASTLNARTEVEKTITLPNHTGMVTSRRIDKAYGGHGVTWNDDRLVPRTVQRAAGHPVRSVFSSLDRAGLDAALFASKSKFKLFKRSWPSGVDRMVIQGYNPTLVDDVDQDLTTQWRALTFVHLSLPDVKGHAYGWLSAPYLKAVEQTDDRIAEILDTVTATTASSDHTLVVVTSDHGGKGKGHSNPGLLADYRIPFFVWGPGVPAGVDLYDLNPTYRDPGTRRPGYGANRQPIRNADVANLVLDVLGLPAIPHSELDADQDLEVFTPTP
jgi:hypothetical protein